MHVNDLLGAERFVGVMPVLVGTMVKGTAIFLVGAVCALMARAASAATRHLIWTLTLAGALATPVVSAVVPRLGVRIPRLSLPTMAAPFEAITSLPALNGASSNAVFALTPREQSSVATIVVPSDDAADVRPGAPVVVTVFGGTAADVEEHAAPVAPSSDRVIVAPSSVVWESRSVSITPDEAMPPVIVGNMSGDSLVPAVIPWLVALWLVGVIVAVAPAIVGMVRLASVARRARPMRGGRWALLVPSAMRQLDVRRRVRFVELDEPVMPMTWGVVRPIVLLPADDFNSTIEQRLDVLRHELAHVRRYDCLTQLIAQLACALHWFNPLAWMAASQMRAERERACDDEVLRAGSKASDYADYLLRVARSTHIVGAAALGGLAMARPSQMAGRLLAVLDDDRPRSRVSAGTTRGASLAAGLIVAGIASLAPASADARANIDALAPVAAIAGIPANFSVGVSEGVGGGVAGGVRVSVATPALATTVSSAAADVDPSAVIVADTPAIVTVMPSPAAIVAAAPRLAPFRTAPCDRTARRGDGGSHTNWTSSDNGEKRWRVLWSEGECSFEIDAHGEIKWNRDVTDIQSISNGGSFSIEQHLGDDTKRLQIRPRADGTLDRTYSVNGAKQEYDDAARAWFAEAIVALDRHTAFAADQRVPAILERSGVDGVLQEITLVETDYARRRYYTKLLSMRQLDRAQVRRVVEQAGAQMSSDYEIAELLIAVSKLDAFSDDSHTAFVAAAKKINSDYERRRVLNALLQRDRLAPTTVQALLEAASGISSDYELAELLIDVSKRYAINEQTRPVYIKAVGSIKSDYEHRRVLATIVASGGLTPTLTRTLLEDARRIESDYELAEFLIQIGKKGGLDATTRDAYFAAADKIGSDYEHHRALSPLLTKDLLTKELAKAILTSASKIDSDYECASLLVEVANAISIDDDLRPTFERAAGTIQSDYDYGRAMSAVRRSSTR